MFSFNIFAYLSVTFDLFANLPYAYGVAKGVIRTHPITWIIWTLLTLIMAVVQFNEGAGGGGWLLITTTILNMVIAILSLRNGIGEIDKKDYAVLVICLSCFPLYFYFEQAILTALVITLIDGVSFIPMIRKAMRDPTGESAKFQWLMAVAYICSLLAMSVYTLSSCLFPAAMVLMHGMTGIIILIFRKKYEG